MLIVREDKNRPQSQGQIFVELTKNRGLDIVNCDRLGYWCDKGHLSHFVLELTKVLTTSELEEILNCKILNK